MGGSCKGGCLEDAKPQLASWQICLEVRAGLRGLHRTTHWVSNNMIETELSSDSSVLVTVAPKCFVMHSVHMGFDSIAGS